MRFIRQDDKDIKDVKTVKEEHVMKNLQHRQADDKSAYTTSKDMAAINKSFNFKIIKKDAGVKCRSYKDITRSRDNREHDKKYNPDNYKEQITLVKSCGCRRESVLVAKPERFIWKDGFPVKVHLIEKDGKERDASILKKYQKNSRKS